MKDLLKLLDLSREEIVRILDGNSFVAAISVAV